MYKKPAGQEQSKIHTNIMYMGIPCLDAVIQFAKPSYKAAGVKFRPDGISLYQALNWEIHCSSIRAVDYKTPFEGVFALLNAAGITRGTVSDGSDLDGKFLKLDASVITCDLHDVCPSLQVKFNRVLFTFEALGACVSNSYPLGMWPD